MPLSRIRPAVAGDAPSIALLTGSLGYPSDERAVSRRLAPILQSPGDLALVADEEGVVVGWIHVETVSRPEADPFAEICGLVVAETHRRQGIGRTLIEAAEAWIADRGLKKTRIHSRAERSAAHDFYRNLGSRVTKTQLVFGSPKRVVGPR